MAADLHLPDYRLLAKRSSDETLERLHREHQEAARKARDAWFMHEQIAFAIFIEQTVRASGRASSDA